MGSEKDGVRAARHGSCETNNQNKHFFWYEKTRLFKESVIPLKMAHLLYI